MTYRQHVCSAN